MMDLLLWLGTLLMALGFISFIGFIPFFFDGLLTFMFGATWNMVLMMLERHDMM